MKKGKVAFAELPQTQQIPDTGLYEAVPGILSEGGADPLSQ